MAKRQKNGNVHHYTYYHCTKRKGACNQKTIRDNKLEDTIREKLSVIAIPQEFREWAMQAIQKENKEEFTSKKSLISSQQKAYNACLDEYDGLVSMRARTQIDDETFTRKKSVLEQEKKRLKGLLDETDKAIDDWLERAEHLFNFAEIGKLRFDFGTITDKKEILSFLGSNLLLFDKELRITATNELILIQDMASEEKAIRNRLEPLGFGSDKTKLWAEYAQSPMMLRR